MEFFDPFPYPVLRETTPTGGGGQTLYAQGP